VYITGIYLVGKTGASETGTDRWRAVVNTVTELWAPDITVNLLPSQATVSTSGRTTVPAGGYSHVKPITRILRKATIE